MMRVNWRKYVTVTVFRRPRKATRKLQYGVHQRKARVKKCSGQGRCGRCGCYGPVVTI